jgi:hypothetical protein
MTRARMLLTAMAMLALVGGCATAARAGADAGALPAGGGNDMG